MTELIDRFNDMVKKLGGLPGFSHVNHLDLRRRLPNDATYKKFWANKLHPTDRGFDLVTAKFASLI
jgi:hypothetical protein